MARSRSSSPSPTKRRLINGRNMTCPRCKRPEDILKFEPMMQIEEYADETTPVVKCPNCRWVFAPADHVRIEILEKGFGALGGENGSAE